MEHNAGALRERVEVLTLTETEEGWEWSPVRETWAGVELTGKSNLFSRVGIGARDALILLRRQELTLHQAVRWRRRHLFLTEITEPERGWMEVRAAAVSITDCLADAGGAPQGPRFPGVLTEKYVRFEQGDPMEGHTVGYVLVTPKTVTLTPGRLVDVAGTPYHVLAPHELDEYKNEYEIERVGEH